MTTSAAASESGTPTPAAVPVVDDETQGAPWWVYILLIIGACVLPVIAGGIVWYNWDHWLTAADTLTGVCKLFVLALLIGSALCVGAIGGLRITSSNKAHMEWFGTFLVFVSALLIGFLGSLRINTVDDFAAYRSLVTTQGEKGSVEDEPTIQIVDWDKTGEVKYKLGDIQYLWVAVTVEYEPGHDLPPRKTDVFYSVKPDADGVVTFTIPEATLKFATRVGVFYAQSDGPSGEDYVVKP